MPDARAYRLSELTPDHPMTGIERRRVIGEKMMISEVRLQFGASVPTHAHKNEQFALVVSGHLRLTIKGADGTGRVVEARAGEVVHLPSNVPHSAEALEDTIVLDLFSPPSEGTGVDG